MKDKKTTIPYTPTTEESERRAEVYKYLQEMIDLKKKKYPHFSGPDGERSFLEYIDASERILNAYTPSREDSSKSDWQSNIVDNIARAKLRAIATSVGLKVPEMKYTATNSKGLISSPRADIIKYIVKHSFLDGNPTLQSFLEVWQMLSHGGVIVYDGYKSGGSKVKKVKSFDMEKGTVETEETYIKVQGKPFSTIISPNDFYWYDMFKRDIQHQPRIIWLQRYTERELETEFGKFKNFKYIASKAAVAEYSINQETLHYKAWSDRVDEQDYEVLKYFSKEEDAYEIWINGVPILRVPLIWGEDEKYYPFAKSISEPFANAEFFWGMSLPHLLEGYQIAKTDILNTTIDKLYRSLVPPMLVGLANKDLFDVQNELIDQDNRFYVPDVNQVKPFPYQGVEQAELSMLNLMDQGIDRMSVDVAQTGQQGKGVTAREVMLADERANQLKGMLFMFLEDLWLQKNKLRIRTILSHYIKDKAFGKDISEQIIRVPDVEFKDGVRGTLDIHIAKNKNQRMPLLDVYAREDAASAQGQVYKIITLPQDYLDEWVYDFQVVTESLYNQNRLRQETDVTDFWTKMITLNPEFVASNKDKMTDEFMSIYGKTKDQYNPPAKTQPQGASPLQEGGQALNELAISSGPLAEGGQALKQ